MVPQRRFEGLPYSLATDRRHRPNYPGPTRTCPDGMLPELAVGCARMRIFARVAELSLVCRKVRPDTEGPCLTRPWSSS
ncbi:hypothetical protein SGPA1_50488 [Streptomyces misionensis JCM 4497]